MRKKRRKNPAGLLTGALGLCCALVVGAIFYAAMAYQLAGEPEGAARQEAARGLLALDGGTLVSETQALSREGGVQCTAVARVYVLEDGTQAEAITAQPAAYIERLSEEKWTAQLMTGFALAGMDAVYAVRGEDGMLCAREGETVYALLAQADEQTLYGLGTSAGLE